MNYSFIEYNILSYLLKNNAFSYDEVVEWAYSQYSSTGVDSFIEKLSMAYDVSDMREQISTYFQVYGEPDQVFLAGETASKYFKGQLPLCETISRILFDLDLAFSEEDKQALYVAEDYFGWHDNADGEAIKLVLPILKGYVSVYDDAVKKFCI